MRSYSDLPKEITFSIPSRLPAKFIGLCRCVSNPWRTLLSTPEFIKTHLQLSRNLREESLLLIFDDFYLSYASMSDARHLFDEITVSEKKIYFSGHSNRWYRIHASCNGLIFLRDLNRDKFVINPVTREIRKVDDSAVTFQTLIFYGFGYESESDDYKIVRIHKDYWSKAYPDRPPEMFVDVYSLRSDSWKRVGNSPYHNYASVFTKGFYVNGCIYWLTTSINESKNTVVSFDLLQEKFCVVPTSGFSADGGLLFWIMKEYGVEQWLSKFRINYPQLKGVIPLCTLGQDELVLKDNKKLYAYNLKEEELKHIVVDGFGQFFRDAVSFVESLVSPYCIVKKLHS